MFRIVSVVIAVLLAAAGIHATVTATAPAAPGGTSVVLVLFVAACGFWLGRKFARASAEAHATAIANARASAMARAAAQAKAQQLVIVNTAQPVEHPQYVEGDSFDDDVDLEEVEGGDGERAQAISGALPRPALDPYIHPRLGVHYPPAFPIAASSASDVAAVKAPAFPGGGETSCVSQVREHLPRLDGLDVEAMIDARDGRGTPVFDQWPFTQDAPRSGVTPV